MTEKNSIVVWVQHSKKLLNNLVHINYKGKSTWFCLKWRTTIKQLNRKQIIILNHDDGSVDQLVYKTKTEWSLTNVRQPKNILFQAFSF